MDKSKKAANDIMVLRFSQTGESYQRLVEKIAKLIVIKKRE